MLSFGAAKVKGTNRVETVFIELWSFFSEENGMVSRTGPNKLGIIILLCVATLICLFVC